MTPMRPISRIYPPSFSRLDTEQMRLHNPCRTVYGSSTVTPHLFISRLSGQCGENFSARLCGTRSRCSVFLATSSSSHPHACVTGMFRDPLSAMTERRCRRSATNSLAFTSDISCCSLQESLGRFSYVKWLYFSSIAIDSLRDTPPVLLKYDRYGLSSQNVDSTMPIYNHFQRGYATLLH